MNEEFRKLRVVSADREKRAKLIMIREGGWDGVYPIPMTYRGGIKASELIKIQECDEDFSLLHSSGDDKCCWVGNAITACIFFIHGHDVVQDPKILAKRKTFKD